MRILATVAFSFSAGIFAAVLLPFDGWILWAAAACLLAGLAALPLARRRRGALRTALIALPLAAALLYYTGCDMLRAEPVRRLCGEETRPFAAVVCDWPEETPYGAKVTALLEGHGGVKAVVYGEKTLLSLVPGDRLTGAARWQDAGYIRETEVTTFTARGVYVLLYAEGTPVQEPGTAGSIRWWPQRLNRAFRERIAAIWEDGRIAGVVAGMLTGDKSGIPETDYTAMREAGLAHLFAVSGLHCAFLVSLLALLIPRRFRAAGCAVTIGVLLLYMCMVGLTPSVVRACVMQIFLLLAPLLRRDSDGPTAVGAALLLILLANPWAAASVSLQLSFAATAGMSLLAPRLYETWMRRCRGENRLWRRCVSFFAANLSAVLGAMAFTAPLTAYYFNTLSLVAPLSGLLAVPLAGWGFMASFLAVLAGFASLPAAQIVGLAGGGCVRVILWAAGALLRVPYHAVYFSDRIFWAWLLYTYAAFVGCAATRDHRRKYTACAVLSAMGLAAVLWINQAQYRYGEMNVLALDVGQGESVVLYAGNDAALLDCGSSSRGLRAGDVAVEQLSSMGIFHLRSVVVSHYHADHTNGVDAVLRRLTVDTLYLPDIEDEYGVRERLVATAQEQGIETVFVRTERTVPLGGAEMTVYPPVGVGDMNEQGLTVLGSAGDFDVLFTGDMAGSTECALLERYFLPDIEVLLVSHHGSGGSSSGEFLEEITPEVAIISVGENDYGHPHPGALLRLSAVGAEIYRTDECGHVRVSAHGGDS